MRIVIASVIVVLLCPALLFAGGFKLALQGTKQLGMGHTGIGFAQDAATIYFNPAGMSIIPDQVIGSMNILLPSTSFLEKNTNKLTNTISNVYTPFSLYAKRHLGKRCNLGLGIYTPFGSGLHYPYAWSGRFILTDISLSTIFLQPTISWKLSDKLSIGAAYIYSYGTFTLEKDLTIQSVSNPDLYGHAKLQGNGHSNGYQLGIYYHNQDRFSLGLSYHSALKMKVENGSADFMNIPQALYDQFPINETFRSTLPLPAEIGAGLSFQLSKKITAAFDINYTYWQTYDYLSFDYSNNTSTLIDTRSPRLYQNAMTFRGGVTAALANDMKIRFGAFYDQTPTQPGYVGPELPDNNRIGVTTGLTYPIHQNFKLDVALLYEDVIKRTELNLESKLYGAYKTKVLCPTIGLNYIFNDPRKQENKNQMNY